jgi:hypothetical protein
VSLWALAAWGVLATAVPEPLALPGFRLHLEASEDIDPDRLEALAQGGVVLWLTTRSNQLKRSTEERLGRFEAAHVEVRPPWTAAVRQQFVGRVHPWVQEEGLDVAAYRRWAPLGTALELAGVLSEEKLTRALALHPLLVRWRPEGVPTTDEWARAVRLPGLEVHPQTKLPDCGRPMKRAARIRLRVPAVDAGNSGAGCGFALRLEVPPALSEGELKALLVAQPGAELWTSVRSDGDAAAVRRLLELLTAAVPLPAGGSPARSR